ncbi:MULTISPECIES: xanthine dehydrogenase family protein molybdopterin-binding subunit [Bradyrhizobium]|jgi:carbon-monoxide dehydrogenase large subunit|uniref:Xanthine dehydrogenase family protein n=3 Tax=Bradyrhizobium TaxID=374 RepID=A0ABS5GER5_9BRAD|nr:MULTISPECIES: xanthine dehydrogenase family protein molybdopterin-binding subunit [Bradyrhizobium]MBR1139601.1 xanthine dehydrogenase family protein [Bradyrhizobium denitrificans]MDU0954082.1 xanthine dehydrogenase family protein molybdopterin-binding subunit [Bradyrhizobium sp.]MDU1495396.1 xanthine dehydrogenase family protein molybdopterin-binding subunit [Bradyrhizobium sp.]MDU1545417.1 xanthine dehydrogenase family protein molybdopterin-binding subunit [Bradyrhizobium sp.]MDU1664998.1 
MTAPLTPLDRPNSYIGRSVPRPNAKRLLAGRGRYVTDIRLPRMLHAAFLRSPHAHARIISIDADAARALAGVHLIATGADLARICTPWTGTLDHFKGMTSEPQLPLPLDRVVWAGQAVVAVVADSRALAEDALELISVDYEELPAVVDLDEARQPGTPRANPASQSNICFRTQLDSGGVDEVFVAAAHVIEQQFSFGRHTPVTLEPRAIVADYEPDSGMLTVHHATQTPYQFQDLYSRHYNIPEARVRVIAPDIGGSFGMKLHVYHEDMAVVGLSMMLGRPVKYVADRIESFVSDIHARDHRVQARMAIDADGKILAMDVHDATAIGAFSTYPRTSVVEGNQVIRLIGAPYGFTSYRAALEVVFQNKVQTSQYRAVGHPIACAVTERMVDIAAGRAGLDPLAMRDRNVIADDAYPLVSPTGYKFEALSHQACLRRLREIMDYDALRGEQAELRRRGVHRGIGIATFVEITNPSPAFYGVGGARISSQDGATISLTPTGEVRCAISVTEQGQGTEAIIGQIVADQLGLAQEHVKVITGDTEVTPHGGATWACRGAGIGGETALQAARRLKANILAIAALVLQEQAAALDIVDGQVVSAASRQPRLDVAEIARIAYFRSDTLPPGTQAQLTVSHHFAPQGYPFAFTNGIQGCSLEVDVDTGFVKLLKHYVVEDCGRIINPMLVDEQLRGGVVQGLGAALFEECRYGETGQLLNGSLADYLVPMAMEMPDIVIDHVETPTADTILGAKGCGEAGTAAASACVLNAVNDALTPFGASINTIPITPARILKALNRY